MFIVEQVAMLDGRWPRFQRRGATPTDGKQLLDAGVRVTPALLPRKAFAQRDGDGAGHGLARQPRQVASEQTSFLVLDVQTHDPPRGGRTYLYLPYASSQLPARPRRTWPRQSGGTRPVRRIDGDGAGCVLPRAPWSRLVLEHRGVTGHVDELHRPVRAAHVGQS